MFLLRLKLPHPPISAYHHLRWKVAEQQRCFSDQDISWKDENLKNKMVFFVFLYNPHKCSGTRLMVTWYQDKKMIGSE